MSSDTLSPLVAGSHFLPGLEPMPHGLAILGGHLSCISRPTKLLDLVPNFTFLNLGSGDLPNFPRSSPIDLP